MSNYTTHIWKGSLTTTNTISKHQLIELLEKQFKCLYNAKVSKLEDWRKKRFRTRGKFFSQRSETSQFVMRGGRGGGSCSGTKEIWAGNWRRTKDFSIARTLTGGGERELLGIGIFVKHKIFSRSHIKCFNIAVALYCMKFIDKFNFP